MFEFAPLRSASRALAASAASAALVVAWTGSPAPAREIGAVAAANPLIEGAAPIGGRRALYIGARVVENERIFTSPVGSGQVLFDDQTTLTVAPGSDVVLDKYVYDAAADTGDLGLTLTKGAMRFIGGRLSKSKDAVVRTPTATIGIRGGMALLTVGDDGKLKVISLAGAYVRIDTGGEVLFLSRPNAAAVVEAEGSHIEYLGLVDSAQLDEIYDLFEIPGGGGAAVPPTDDQTANSGIVVVGSEELGALYRNPVTTEGGEPSDTPVLDPVIIGRDYLIDEIVGGPTASAPLIIGTPLAATGQGFFAGTTPFTNAGGGLVPDPAASGVYFTPTGTVPFVATFEGSRIGLGPGGEIVSIPTEKATPEDRYFTFDETDAGTPAGAPTGRGFFDEDADFTIALFDFYDGEPEGEFTPVPVMIGAAIIGDTTPGQLASVGADVGSQLLREYRLDFAIDGVTNGAILPYGLTYAGEALNSSLVIVGDPGGSLFGPSGSVGDPTGATKAGSALLAVSGEGLSQSSSFGGFASEWRTNGSAPTISGEVFVTAEDSFGGYAASSTSGVAAIGTIEDGSDPDGGAVFFGPSGEFLVLGTSARFLDDDPDVDYGSGVATNWADWTGGVEESAFGFIALAELESETAVGTDSRYMLATTANDRLAAIGAPTNDGDTNTGALTGGFSASIRQVMTSDSTSPDYSIQRSTSSDGVTAVFDKSTNSATVTLKDVLTVTGDGSDARTLTLGAETGESAFIDDKRFVAEARTATGATGNGVIATSGLSGDGGVFPAEATYECGCTTLPVTTEHEYMRWGYWSGEATVMGDEAPTEVIERHHAGAWVAGDLSRPDELPTHGTVRHSGHAVVTVAREGATYIAGGGYHLKFDFGSRSGTAEFQDLGGYNIETTVAAPPSANSFSGGFSGVSPTDATAGLPTVSGVVDGAFFKGGGHPAMASGGSIGFSSDDASNPLDAAGVFAGEKY